MAGAGKTAGMTGIAGFNAASAEVAERAVLTCCQSTSLARAITAGRPYPHLNDLLAATDTAFESLAWDDVLEAVLAHQRIGETRNPSAEQSGVADADRAQLAAANAAYEQRFGHVFLIQASGRDGQQMLAELDRRLQNSPEAERDETRRELRDITRLRMTGMLGATQSRATLSTHVLDAMSGRPATGVAVLLEGRTPDGGWARHGSGRTDDDGRLRLPDPLPAAVYRITFQTGEYFAGRGVESFYPEVTVTFTVPDTHGPEHFHVPLLLSPYSYSTYRGS